MTAPSAQVVTVGAAPGAMAAPGSEVAAILGAAGIPVGSRVLIEDDEAALEHALRTELPLTVIVGGVTGSAGDIVRRAIARIVGSRLVLNERVLRALEDHYVGHERPLPRRAERLALLPQGATVWLSDEGEPAWLVEAGARLLVAVPHGAAAVTSLQRHVVPALRERFAGRGVVVVRSLRTTGVSLADIEDRLVEWLGKEGEVAVSTVPADGEVWVRLRARGASAADAETAIGEVEAAVTKALGEDCYGRDADSIEQVLGRLLSERQLTVSVAESCTGGLLGHRLTSIAGSSAYFERGVIVYSNRAKQELLGVSEAILRAHGAVSGPCAEAMAAGITRMSGSACGLAITGIAGPDGGTPAKPVGTVFIGVAVGDRAVAHHFRFAGERAAVKWQSSQAALDLLRRRLLRER
jgi:nicotinamide-nucleotide amidase